jgi:predicted alpha-1,2-mannosidase
MNDVPPLAAILRSVSVLLMLWTQTILGFQSVQVTQYVNPFVGTDAHGHTFPGATVPFGMVQLSPDTRVEGWDACAGYHYSDSTILGFSHTHLSGTGIADYGDILFLPTVGRLPGKDVRSKFRHSNEDASPGYYRVLLEDSGILAELTATARVGVHRYTFPRTDRAHLLINLQHGLGPDQVIESWLSRTGNHEIVGYRRSRGWAKDQHVYFVARFSEPILLHGFYQNDALRSKALLVSGTNVKGFLRFSTIDGRPLVIKVGISSVDVDGARRNLDAEASTADFDAIRASADSLWNVELNKIVVEGGSNEQRNTFYTALYHTMIAPNVFSDVDGRYRAMDGTIRRAEGYSMYTVFSLWDTFRALHPLLTLIDRRRTADFINSMLAKYQEGGVLPVWELAANETWTMIGYHSVPVIVDAYAKGVRNFNAGLALDAMKHSAMLDHFGLDAYREHGYIPGDKDGESVSKTLEYAFDDWCIAHMAGMLGRTEDEEYFGSRALSYQNVFDPTTGFMRPRINGMWVEPFDPRSVTMHYTEANAWQYAFFVPHDIHGHIGLLGGKQRFVEKLDSLFFTESILTGRDQSDITGLIGQYAQGNEPSHHFAYLYNYAGAPWKTQQIVRTILDSLFTDKPNGLSGNDDCGQMSAWYVFSALGFYPVTPGQPVYAIGSPLFERATIRLENGSNFVVSAQGNSKSNRYIQSARFNGSTYEKSFLLHDDIVRGGELTLTLGPFPNAAWASREEASPPSPRLKPIVPVPWVVAESTIFADSVVVQLRCLDSTAVIRYTSDGSTPTVSSTEYVRPLTMRHPTIVNAIAVRSDGSTSKTATSEFLKHKPIGLLSLRTSYSPQYTGGGKNALIDGQRGGLNFRLGAWQGYEGSDLDAVIDLQSVRSVSRVALSALQDIDVWIFFPREVAVSFSLDGSKFGNEVLVRNPVSERDAKVQLRDFVAAVKNVRARYVRVRARNIGVCPPWHKGAGGKAWVFADEILIDAQETLQ